PSSNSCREKPTKLRSSSKTRSPSVRYCYILTFSENRLLVPAFSSTADGQRGTPRRPSADGVTRLPSPLPYVFHLQGIAPKLLTHRSITLIRPTNHLSSYLIVTLVGVKPHGRAVRIISCDMFE